MGKTEGNPQKLGHTMLVIKARNLNTIKNSQKLFTVSETKIGQALTALFGAETAAKYGLYA